jgi:hypothetical protein
LVVATTAAVNREFEMGRAPTTQQSLGVGQDRPFTASTWAEKLWTSQVVPASVVSMTDGRPELTCCPIAQQAVLVGHDRPLKKSMPLGVV